MSGTPAPSRLHRKIAVQASRGGTLTPDLEADAARRLGALALVVAIATLIIGTILQFGRAPAVLGAGVRMGVNAADVALSLALYFAIAKAWVTPKRALELGLGYQVGRGLLSAIVFHAHTMVPGVSVRGWTPIAVWAMLFPLIVPSSPRRVVIGTLATVAMDPLALWAITLAGAPRPATSELVQMLFPSAMVIAFAPIAARIVYGLTLKVREAREMGSYRLVEKLGQGGMGEVWRAEHRMLARGAAIKLIHPGALGAGEGTHASEMVKRFEREAQATATLRSPHTIEVYDYGLAADGTFHYVMELLDGFSLQTLVARFGPLPPERVVHFLRQACHSLAEAHAAGLVHRDVKPANMFVCRLGLDLDFVKVLDFGLVKLQGPQAHGAEALTVEGAFTGTPGYMPPEIALGAEPVDGRADIYALGCVAYWLLTGQRVFEGSNPMQVIVDHARTPPVPPSKRARQAIPAELERIVMRCLEKDPGQRPASASELSRELQALGIEALWTEARAREWWRAHQPSVSTGEEGSLPEIELSYGETRSQTSPLATRRA
jgi:serine/threonine-protein kinase